MNAILAAINYALAGLNVYLWQEGSEFASFNLGVAVLVFGIGILFSAQK